MGGGGGAHREGGKEGGMRHGMEWDEKRTMEEKEDIDRDERTWGVSSVRKRYIDRKKMGQCTRSGRKLVRVKRRT